MKFKKSERESPYFQYGTDKQFQDFVRTLSSAYSRDTENIIFAHYRTAANSGVGIKPPYSGIPLTVSEHNQQHQHGQYAFMPREWWEKKTNEYLEMWINSIRREK